MKLKLKPTFSTTEITNEINSPIRVDLSFRKIKHIHTFKSDVSKDHVLCLSLEHPLQNGYTTYFLKNKLDIENVMAYAQANGIEVKEA